MGKMKFFNVAAIAAMATATAGALAQQADAAAGAQSAQSTITMELQREMPRMVRVVQANDDISTPGTQFRPGASPPALFERSAVPLLKQVQATEEQIAKLTKVNADLWELRTHDQDATSPEVSRQVKALIHEQMTVLTPEQFQKMIDILDKRRSEAQSRAAGASGTK
jgi:hypothetical protein